MNKKQLIIPIITGLLIGGFVLAISSYTITNSDVTINESSDIVDEVPMGAMPGNELWSETFSVDGLTTHYYHKPFAAATNTPFAMLSPGVTTTIEYFGFEIATATGTDNVLEVATSTNAFATSSEDQLLEATVASDTLGTFRWISVGGIVQDNVIGPNTWLIIDGSSEEAGGFTYTGSFVTVILQEF